MADDLDALPWSGRKPTPEQIDRILDLHGKWRRGEGGQRADLSSADLTLAKLSGADLSGADLTSAKLTLAKLTLAKLSGADLTGADLWRASLWRANLTLADLSDANLSDADLSGADLSGVSLTGADLAGCIGDMRHVRSMQIERWPITWTADVLQIGCQRHPIAAWWRFQDDDISAMDPDALEWWRKWRGAIRQIIELSPAERTVADVSGGGDA